MSWFRRKRADVVAIEKRLGYRFSDTALLERALTHRSHAHERRDGVAPHYERLEFLGDSLLGFLVSDWLYKGDGEAPEGVLTRRRQVVVRTSTLAATARQLGLGDAIRLGRGEERTGGREKPSLLADLFEAVLAAVYMDGGLRPARAFVKRHLGPVLGEIQEPGKSSDDYKTRLQETTQGKLRRIPRYRIVSTSGPAHALRFEVEVMVNGRVLGKGSGTNRKRAEQEAARQGLDRLEQDDEA